MSEKFKIECEGVLTAHSYGNTLPSKEDMLSVIQKIPNGSIITDIGIYPYSAEEKDDVKIKIVYKLTGDDCTQLPFSYVATKDLWGSDEEHD